jgi:ferredoxin
MPEVEYISYGVVEEREWRLDSEQTFEKAAAADLDREDYGSMEVSETESILDAAQREGLGWSMKCLKGGCGRCSALVVDGDVEMDDEQEFFARADVGARDICLPCVASPETDLKLVYGVSERDSLEQHVK